MVSLRSFRNADVPALVNCWNEHHRSAGYEQMVTPSQFETAILDRQGFRASDVLIAEMDGRVAGFLHRPTFRQTISSRIAAVCIRNLPQVDLIARVLIAAAIEQGTVWAGLDLDSRAGYVGLSPDTGLVGVADRDVAWVHWLIDQGFQISRQYQGLSVMLDTFRVPVDRRLLMLMRSTLVSERTEEPTGDDPEFVARWGHLEPMYFELRERTGRSLATVTVWTASYGGLLSRPEALLTDLLVMPGSPDGSALHLVAETLRALATRRYGIVRVVSPAALSPKQPWESLGFTRFTSGAVYHRGDA